MDSASGMPALHARRSSAQPDVAAMQRMLAWRGSAQPGVAAMEHVLALRRSAQQLVLADGEDNLSALRGRRGSAQPDVAAMQQILALRQSVQQLAADRRATARKVRRGWPFEMLEHLSRISKEKERKQGEGFRLGSTTQGKMRLKGTELRWRHRRATAGIARPDKAGPTESHTPFPRGGVGSLFKRKKNPVACGR
eukprot:362799-Chlamydomonas_euryale.AAC.1